MENNVEINTIKNISESPGGIPFVLNFSGKNKDGEVTRWIGSMFGNFRVEIVDFDKREVKLSIMNALQTFSYAELEPCCITNQYLTRLIDGEKFTEDIFKKIIALAIMTTYNNIGFIDVSQGLNNVIDQYVAYYRGIKDRLQSVERNVTV